MRTARTIVALVVATALAGPGAPAAAEQATDCGESAPGNGTGYRPPPNRAALPSPAERPGPDILYEPLATAPQLENTGVWSADPIMVSGARAYRDGEFVYQDFLYDDRALAYPDEPERYAGNAADFVELRIKPLERSLGIRITYNSMLDVDAVAATIALGDSQEPQTMPHDAGAVAPAEVFVTVHGCDGDIVRASDGEVLPITPAVGTDLLRRQVHVEVPYEAFDPRGDTAVRITAAAGLWDTAAGRYLRPDVARPAFFNVAFREYGPWTANTWMDASQNAALAAGDLTPLFATVDATLLAAGVDDELSGQPGGVPVTGPMNRIHVSHFEPVQGRGSDTGGGGVAGDFACDPPECTPQFSGRLQPYTVYVPDVPAPPEGYALVINLHGANSNHNHFELGPPAHALDTWQMLAEAGRPAIMALPNARGASYFYHGLAAADVFEVWADVAAHYGLDPGYVIQTGSSMGGYGTYKMGVQFPDLYTAIFPNIGPSGPIAAHAPPAPTPEPGSDTWRMFAGLRHVPVLATQNENDPIVPITSTRHAMQTLHDLGYRYDYWWFTGADGGAGHAEYRHYVREHYAALFELGPTDRNPHRVTYVMSPRISETPYGLTSDHAYWVSDIVVRDTSADQTGSIDVVSHGFGRGDPAASEAEESNGVGGNGLPYSRVRRGWEATPAAAVADVLDVTASNIASVTIDVDRARVSCDATVNVDSDGPLRVTLAGRACPGPLATVGRPGDDPTTAAISWSQLAFASGEASEALYASDEVFADALASGPLQPSSPLLLGDPQQLEQAILDELRRLGVEQVRILGGIAAVSEAVADAIRAADFQVVRTAGPTRLETAAAIAELTTGPDALLARAFEDADSPTRAFADSMAAGAWAAQTGYPLLLTQTDDLSSTTRTVLTSRRPGEVVVVGGTAAVSPQVEDRLDEDGHQHRRIAGADRAATAVAIAEARGFSGDTPARAVVLVDGEAADAWTRGSPAAGFSAANDAPILLATGDHLPEATRQFLASSVAPRDGETVVWCAASSVACDAALAAITE